MVNKSEVFPEILKHVNQAFEANVLAGIIRFRFAETPKLSDGNLGQDIMVRDIMANDSRVFSIIGLDCGLSRLHDARQV